MGAPLGLFAGDIQFTFLPQKWIWFETVKNEGRLPVWNSYIYGGLPYFADPKSGVLDPLNFVFLFFSRENFLQGFFWFIYLKLPLLFFSMLLLLRELQIHRYLALAFAAIYAGCALSVSLLTYPNTMAGLYLTPLFIWLLSKRAKSNPGHRNFWNIAIAVIPALALYSAAPDFAVIMLGLLLMQLLRRPRVGSLMEFCFISFMIMGLMSPILLPGLEYSVSTPRHFTNKDPVSGTVFPFHPLRMLELFLPQPFGAKTESFNFWGNPILFGNFQFLFNSIFMGVALPIGLFFHFYLTRPNRRKLWLVLTLILLVLSFSFFLPGGFHNFLYQTIPPFRIFRAAEKFLVFLFLLWLVISAKGWQKWFSLLKLKQVLATRLLLSTQLIFIFIVAIILLQIPAEIRWHPTITNGLIQSSIFLVVFIALAFSRKFLKISHLKIIFLSVLLLELVIVREKVLWFQSWERLNSPLAEKIQISKKDRWEEISQGGARRFTGLATVRESFAVAETIGTDVVGTKTSRQAIFLTPGVAPLYGVEEISGTLAMHDARRVKFLRSISAKDAAFFLDFTSVYWFASTVPGEKSPVLKQNTDALPFIYVPANVISLNSKEAAEEYVNENLSKNWRETAAIVANTGNLDFNSNLNSVVEIPAIKIAKEKNGHIAIDLTYASGSSGRGHWLVLNEGYNPHWLMIAGKNEAPAVLANAWAMAGWVPEACASPCRVILEYRNPLIKNGVFLAVVSFFCLLAVALWQNSRFRLNNQQLS